MITVLQEIAADPEVRALIINQAVINTNAAVDQFMEMRDDVFIVYCTPAENPPDVALRANLAINTNDPLIGVLIVEQAYAMGAEVFAHYSFPRHLSMATIAMRRENMIETAERLGIEFVDLTAPDPTSDVGIPGTQQFIMEDVPRQVAELGVNTAFFATNCAMQVPLITRVIEYGAIYPQPCCPSPYHGFPAALGIEDSIPTGDFDDDGNEIMRLRSLPEVIEETRAELAARGVAGRLSTWPSPASMMWTTAATEYAILWINGEVDPYVIDMEVFERLCREFAYEMTGEEIGVELNPFSFRGRVFYNYIMVVMDYLTY